MSGMSTETYFNNEKSQVYMVSDQKWAALYKYGSTLTFGRRKEFKKKSTKSFDPNAGWNFLLYIFSSEDLLSIHKYIDFSCGVLKHFRPVLNRVYYYQNVACMKKAHKVISQAKHIRYLMLPEVCVYLQKWEMSMTMCTF